MFTIAKAFRFEAAHRLTHLPEDHKCNSDHGHSYSVELELVSPDLNIDGFVVDFNWLSVFKDWIDQHVDHTNLNVSLPLLGFSGPTTSEHLSKFFYHAAKAMGLPVTACTVRETATTWSRYNP